MAKMYMVPYWINVMWLDVVTYLHHTDKEVMTMERGIELSSPCLYRLTSRLGNILDNRVCLCAANGLVCKLLLGQVLRHL